MEEAVVTERTPETPPDVQSQVDRVLKTAFEHIQSISIARAGEPDNKGGLFPTGVEKIMVKIEVAVSENAHGKVEIEIAGEKAPRAETSFAPEIREYDEPF